MKNSKRASNRDELKNKCYLSTEDENFSTPDIRDVDFRIQYDSMKIRELLRETSTDRTTDLIMLKIILCSGLYPQVAIPDEHNYCKSGSQQLFHTKNKYFVSLHPMSYFYHNSDSLKMLQKDIGVPPLGYFSNFAYSPNHKILIYQ